MNAVSASRASSPQHAGSISSSLIAQLEQLRQLLTAAAKLMYDGDAPRIQATCEDLRTCAVNLQPACAELSPQFDNAAITALDQQRLSLLRSLLEARALYVAAMRRWRRSLRLRRSLLEMQMELPACDDELSRWC